MSSSRVVDMNGEKRFELTLVVEQLRFAMYSSFLFIIILGYTLSKAFADIDYEDNFLKNVFGSTNVCIYFDFPPSTYVLPAIYNIVVLGGVAYALASYVRASIAKEEGKISQGALSMLRCVYVYVAVSVMYFATIFAVEPNPDKPHTMVIHSLPFVNLEIALCLMQLAITWFGTTVAWIDLLPTSYHKACVVHCILLISVTIGKIACQVNALADMNGSKGQGLWWNVRDDKAQMCAQVLDLTWLLLSLVIPLAQSLHLMCQKGNTHALIMNIQDNRPAKSYAAIAPSS